MKGICAFLRAHAKPFFCALLFAALVLFLLSYANAPDEITLELTLREDGRSVYVQQRMLYVNRSKFPMDCLYLHLYANAFMDPDDLPLAQGEFSSVYPNGFSKGQAEIGSLLLNEEAAVWSIDPTQPTLLKIALPSALLPGRSAEIALTYTLTLPDNRHRFGRSDTEIRLLNAFAIPAYHDGSAWHTDPYTPIGDPFVSSIADYNVTLHAPMSYVAAAPGLVGSAENGTWHFKIRDIREFALILSREYHVAQAEGGGVRICAFAFEQAHAQQLARLGAQAADVFSGLYGELPQKELLLCAGEFALSGMEYPNLVLIDRSLMEEEDSLLEFVTAHETAHQWWYASVGSDQVNHPWQDEALSEYSALLYFEAVYGRDSMEALYRKMIRPALERKDLDGLSMDQPIGAFETGALYDALVYKRGAAMWHDVRTLMGNDAFFSALKRYHLDNRGKIAPPEALLQSLGREGSLRALEWLRGERPAR